MKKLIAASMIFAAAAAANALNAADGIHAYVGSYAGSVTVNGKSVSALNAPINFGDTISTGGKSYCEIVFADRNILRINQSSSIEFRVSTVENSLILRSGWLSATIKKLTAKNGRFSIKTPTVSAAIRGTSFCTKVENPDSTYFCVCNGRIELTDAAGVTDTVTSPHHAGRRYVREKSGTITVDTKPGLLYHDDAGLEALSKKIGVAIDWSKAE